MTKTFILFNCFCFGYRYFQVPKIAKKNQVILCNLAEDITKIPDALLVLIPSSADFVHSLGFQHPGFRPQQNILMFETRFFQYLVFSPNPDLV